MYLSSMAIQLSTLLASPTAAGDFCLILDQLCQFAAFLLACAPAGAVKQFVHSIKVREEQTMQEQKLTMKD